MGTSTLTVNGNISPGLMYHIFFYFESLTIGQKLHGLNLSYFGEISDLKNLKILS